jgi:hypothetical protein
MVLIVLEEGKKAEEPPTYETTSALVVRLLLREVRVPAVKPNIAAVGLLSVEILFNVLFDGSPDPLAAA